MADTLGFSKLHGLGNDFILFDHRKLELTRLNATFFPENIKKLCDRRFGIGADQVLRLTDPVSKNGAEVFLSIWNSDGSVATMCGNGLRAVGRYLQDSSSLSSGYVALVETSNGLYTVVCKGETFDVEMGKPAIQSEDQKIEVLGRTFEYRFVEVGNPHAVILVNEDVTKFPTIKFGPLIENDSRFPGGINVEFVQVIQPGVLRVRVWERGAGPTLACGSGASAAAAVAMLKGKCDRTVWVELPGGRLKIEWPSADQPLILSGPADHVFHGKIHHRLLAQNEPDGS